MGGGCILIPLHLRHDSSKSYNRCSLDVIYSVSCSSVARYTCTCIGLCREKSWLTTRVQTDSRFRVVWSASLFSLSEKHYYSPILISVGEYVELSLNEPCYINRKRELVALHHLSSWCLYDCCVALPHGATVLSAYFLIILAYYF